MSIRRIGIFGHYGNSNLGDEAIITAVLHHLRGLHPGAELIAFSSNPTDTQSRHGVPAFPIHAAYHLSVAAKPGAGPAPTASPAAGKAAEGGNATPVFLLPLRRLTGRLLRWARNVGPEIATCGRDYQALKGLDLFIMAGSSQFQDYFEGAWGFPLTNLKWMLLARLAGAKVVCVSVGAVPMRTRLGKFFLRRGLALASYVSLRDHDSQQVLREAGFRGETSVYPDLAHSLESSPGESEAEQRKDGRRVVAINPMPVYYSEYWPEHDAEKYRRYVRAVGEFADRLAGSGYEVLFFSTQPKDELVIKDVLSICTAPSIDRDGGSSSRSHATVAELMRTLRSADVVVATRFHGIVLSLLAERPVLGICYQPKNFQLLGSFGQEAYAIDFESVSADGLWERFKRLEARRAIEAERIGARERECKAALMEQYRRLGELVGNGG